jgi:uncharacterized protein
LTINKILGAVVLNMLKIYKIRSIFLISLTFIVCWTNRVQAVSFDCSKTNSIPEYLICTTPDLSQADDDFKILFDIAKSKADDQYAFKNYAREQWKERQRDCRDVSCLRTWYSKQKKYYSQLGTVTPSSDKTTTANKTPLETLEQESKQAAILAAKLRAAANQVDAPEPLGAMYKEGNLKEHTCYSLGLLVGKADSVRHLEWDKNPLLKAKNSRQSQELRIMAHSLDVFVIAAQYAIDLQPKTRLKEWNSNCVGRFKINDDSIESAQTNAFYKITNNGKVLHVLGDVENGFAAKLRDAIDLNGSVDTIALGSGGDLISEALEAGRYIRLKKLETTLWGNCSSACPFVFMGGTSRNIFSPYPALGFHKLYSSSVPIPITSPAYREITIYMKEMGVLPEFVLKKMISAEPSGMVQLGNTPLLCDNKIATMVQRVCTE